MKAERKILRSATKKYPVGCDEINTRHHWDQITQSFFLDHLACQKNQ